MITNECSSVQPLVLPAPLVSSSAFAASVAATDGTGSASVRASPGAVAATAAAAGPLRGPQKAPTQQLLLLLLSYRLCGGPARARGMIAAATAAAAAGA